MTPDVSLDQQPPADWPHLSSRPCPFCGGLFTMGWRGPSGLVQLACQDCWAMGPTQRRSVAALDAWNTRHEITIEEAIRRAYRPWRLGERSYAPRG